MAKRRRAAGPPAHSRVESHPECRRVVDRALRVEIWSRSLLLVLYLLLAAIACLRALAHDEITFGLLLAGAAGAWASDRIISTRVVRPWQSEALAAVAQRLRDHALHYSIRDFRGWVKDTPGIAALVQSDQLLLCDRSTGYDELLLSKWQVAGLRVEHEHVAVRTSAGSRPIFVGPPGWRRPRAKALIEDRVFLRVYYFVRHDSRPSSTRIPFGGALRDAEGWKEAIERSKRYPAGVSA